MVVDSGGQYLDGTTDITRTVVFDDVSDDEKRDFTITLKSHIALADCRFLYGAAGSNIDAIARSVMWNEGLDYKCGTGHGIGSFLSVHEGTQSISMKPNSVRLEENMLVTIEPGVYKEGRYGIRTENIARVCEDFENECGRFMKFEIMSLCPICLNGIIPEMLTNRERLWLNGYHQQVYDKLSPYLETSKKEWLRKNTMPI
jgi:Xaa-Pro aminopeptidase